MTEYPIGSREQAIMVEEDGGYATLSSNTFADDGHHVGFNIEITPNFSRNMQEITNNGSDSLELISLVPGAELYSFQMKFNPYDFRWLKYCATHADVSDTDHGTYYEHAFSTAGADLNSFALQWTKRQETNQILELYGCVITDFRLEFNKGTGAKESFITVVANCIAKRKVEGSSVASVSYPTETPYKFQDLKFTFGGAAVQELNSGSLQFSTGINPQDSLYAYSDNSSTIGQPIPVKKRYTVNANVNASDKTFWNEWDGTTVGSTNKLEILRGTNDDATFTFTNLYLDPAPLGNTNPEGISSTPIVGVPTTVGVSVNDGFATY